MTMMHTFKARYVCTYVYTVPAYIDMYIHNILCMQMYVAACTKDLQQGNCHTLQCHNSILLVVVAGHSLLKSSEITSVVTLQKMFHRISLSSYSVDTFLHRVGCHEISFELKHSPCTCKAQGVGVLSQLSFFAIFFMQQDTNLWCKFQSVNVIQNYHNRHTKTEFSMTIVVILYGIDTLEFAAV